MDDLEASNNAKSFFYKLKSFKSEKFLNNNKIPITFALLGLIMAGLGTYLYKNTTIFEGDKIEVVAEPTESQDADSKLVVEIAGSVEKPGVYEFKSGDRIEDLMTACGGLSVDADREWVEKFVNRAARLSDGQKIYIQSINNKQESTNSKQTNGTGANSDGGYQNASPVLGVENQGLININTATFAELDKLPGIGQVYGQKIIEQRPYSNTEELLSKGVLPKSTYEKIKEMITIY